MNAAGTQASGAVICNQVVVDPLGANTPVGHSLLPSGAILLVVDTNQNALQPRMMSIDPVTLAATPFAQNGPYTGSAASNAVAWSSRRGEAVILDSFNDVLRGFSLGSSGTGAVITPSTPISTNGSSGETATLLEMAVDPCAGDFLAYGAGLGPNAPGKVPVLAGGGCPTPGASVSLAITSVRGGAAGVANAGSLFLPGAIPPNGALIGLDAYFQCAFNDPTAIRGATLTNGLKMEIR